MGQQTHLYASFATSPMSVYLWFLRMEPFTTLHIEMQAGKFDHANRLFASISDTYRFVTSHINDYRELPPEFYFHPEFLVNANDFDLGLGRNGRINDVELPAWAATPMDFVYQMRKALETPFVSRHLPEWINLFFGTKQADAASFHIYHPDMYASAWTKQTLADPERKAEIEALMTHVGTVPVRLFATAHPYRRPSSAKRGRALTAALPGPVTLATWRDGLSLFAVLGNDVFDGRVEAGEFRARKIAEKQPPIIALRAREGSAIALLERGVVVALRPGGSDPIQPEFAGVSAVEVSSAIVARVADAARLWIADSRSVDCVIPFYGDPIACCAVSKGFRIAVAGTAGGCVVICSLFGGTKVRVMELGEGCVPVLLTVTCAWGFIVSAVRQVIEGRTQNWLFVWNVNGTFIRKVQIGFEVRAWCTWANSTDFDWMLIADERGRVYAAEVFYMDIRRPVWESKDGVSVAALTFVSDGELAGIVTADGQVEVVPMMVAE
jgi:hypothetical protein